MVNLETIIDKIRSKRAELSTHYPIERLAIFGSFARHEATSESDVDIMVEFNKPIGMQFFSLADELEKLLQLKVDLVSKNGIKPAYFAEIEPELIDV